MKSSEFLKLGAMAAFVIAGTRGYATDNYWQAENSDYSGDYTNVAHWSQGHVPTTNEFVYTANNNGATYTITFPDGVVESCANWTLRSGASDVVTVDGRGTTFTQPAMDVSYDTWSSFRFENSNLFKLTRTSSSVTNEGVYFNDFLFVMSNSCHIAFQNGTFDLSRNGGVVRAFANKAKTSASIAVESNATLVTSGEFEWWGCCTNSLIDVNGGTMQGEGMRFPTWQGDNKLSGVDKYLTHLTIRNGGTVDYTSWLVIGDFEDTSTNRVFSLSLDEGSSASFVAISHHYGTFALNMTGGALNLSAKLLLTQKSGSVASLNLTGGKISTKFITAYDTGTATLHADGVTISPTVAYSPFLEGFAAATLGEQGLTLDTDYAVTVAQNFTDADNEDGKLLKTGSAALTLTGTEQDFHTLEVGEGELVLGNGSTLCLSNVADVVVDSGAVLTANGAVTLCSLGVGLDSAGAAVKCGGTIDGFTIASDGVFNITGSRPSGELLVPYVFSDIVDASNFCNWSVSVNGAVSSSLRIGVTSSGLRIYPAGMIIIVK